MLTLKAFLQTLPDVGAREAFASSCGTTLGHLRNVANGWKTCSPALAVAIERNSGKAVRRQTMCPDEWQAIWPELVEAA